MREFLFKNSFMRYYISLFNRNIVYKRRGMGLLFLMFFFGGMLSAFWSAGAAIYGFYVFFICAFLGIFRRSMPNLAGLMPLTSRRKIAYQYLSPLLTMLIITVTIILFSFVMYMLAYIYSLIAGYHIDFDFFTSMFEGIRLALELMGGYGTSFLLLFTLFCFSCGMVYGFIPKKLYRLVFVAVFLFVIYIGFYGIAYPSRNYYYFPFGMSSPFSSSTFENMSMPWLCILLSAIASFGAFAASLWYLNKIVGKKGY